MYNHNNRSLPEISTPAALSPEKSNLVDTQDNDFKMVIINMFKKFKEQMHTFQSQGRENTSKQLNEIKKIIQWG